jgi:branched-chain amino acid transport system permease protein
MSVRLERRLLGNRRLIKNLGYFFLLIILILLPLFLRDSLYELHILVMTCIFIALAMGFNLVWGYTGLLSLSHTAAFGIGAYTAAVFATKLGIPFWLDLPAAGLLAGVTAFLVGIPALKMARTSFVMVTLAFFLIMQIVANQWVVVTNGPSGIVSIPPAKLVLPILGAVEFASRTANYYLNLGYALFVTFLSVRIIHSRVGRVLIAIREDELLAKSFGVNIFKYKLIIFVLGSITAGIVGSLFAHYLTFVGPEVFDFFYVTRLLIIVIAGGSGTIGGVIIGGIIFTILPEVLRIASELREVMFGIVFTLVMLYMPSGIVGKWNDLRALIREKLGYGSS